MHDVTDDLENRARAFRAMVLFLTGFAAAIGVSLLFLLAKVVL